MRLVKKADKILVLLLVVALHYYLFSSINNFNLPDFPVEEWKPLGVPEPHSGWIRSLMGTSMF